jgi:hypothetical protein
MTASLAPNVEAFRAYLRTRADQKRRVTCVTAVTEVKTNTYELHDLVTRVTEIAASFPECPDADERQAIAEMEGGVSPLYSAGFARLQLTPPPGLSVPRWLQAVDDAGRFLDAFGQQAQAMGWPEDALFGSGGLIQTLQGAHVTKITSTTAVLSDSRCEQKKYPEGYTPQQ